MNWKFWNWAGEIRRLLRENERLKRELTNERATHVALQLKHVVLKDQASRTHKPRRRL